MVNQYADYFGAKLYVSALLFRSITANETPQQIGTISTGLNVYGYFIYNPNASDVFVKFYSKAVAPTVGTDTPVMTLQVAAEGTIVLAGTDVLFQLASKGWIAVTTGYEDTDTGAPGSDLIVQANYR